MIGVMTFKGIAVRPDTTSGLTVLNKAAEAGSEAGQYALAEIYDTGLDGVAKNPQLAATWKAAAEKTARDKANAQMLARNAQANAGREGLGLLLLTMMGAATGNGGVSSSDSIDDMRDNRISGCSSGDALDCQSVGMTPPNQ